MKLLTFLYQNRKHAGMLTDRGVALFDGSSDLLEIIRSEAKGGEWLFLTGYGGVADSVRALRLGAYDFLEKPCELDRLDMVVAGAMRSARAQRKLHERAAAEIGRAHV